MTRQMGGEVQLHCAQEELRPTWEWHPLQGTVTDASMRKRASTLQWKKTPSTLILHKTSKHEESSLRMDIQQSLVREASPQIPFVYLWCIFWGIFRILEREKMPDNFQNKAGGQPLFGKSQQIHPNLRVEASLREGYIWSDR